MRLRDGIGDKRPVPLLTCGQAFEAVAKYLSELKTPWTVIFTAGTPAMGLEGSNFVPMDGATRPAQRTIEVKWNRTRVLAHEAKHAIAAERCEPDDLD